MKFLFIIILFFSTSFSFAGELVELTPANLLQLEIMEPDAFSYADGGVYVKHKTQFPFSTSVTCSKKQFVAFVEPKLADRALSVIMMAIATSKTIKFYVNGCIHDYPRATVIMLIP